MLLKIAFNLSMIIYTFINVNGTTYYIKPNGNDDFIGTTDATAWQHISKINAYSRLHGFKAGDKILFKGSFTYTGTILLKGDMPKHDGNQGNEKHPIEISSYAGSTATIYALDSCGICIINAGGFIINNLNIIGSGGEFTSEQGNNKQNGIYFLNNRSDSLTLYGITIKNVEVSGFKLFGICFSVEKSKSVYKDVTISRCQSHHNGEGGIASNSTDQYSIKNLLITHCKTFRNSGISNKTDNHSGNGIVMGAINGGVIEQNEACFNGLLNHCTAGGPVGIWVYQSQNILMQYNESHDNFTGSDKDGGGFDFDGGTNNSIMQYNYSHDNDGAGFLIAQFEGAYPMANNIMRYNISQNDGRKNGYGSFTLWGGEMFSNYLIYNNVVYIDEDNLKNGITPPAVQLLGNLYKNVRFINNLLIAKGNCQLIEAKDAGIDSSNIIFLNNHYVSQNSHAVNWKNKQYFSVGEWKTAISDQEFKDKPDLWSKGWSIFNSNNPVFFTFEHPEIKGIISELISSQKNTKKTKQ